MTHCTQSIFRRLSALLLLALIALPARAEIARPERLEDTLALMAEALAGADWVERVEIDAADHALSVTHQGRDEAMTAYPDNLHRNLQNAASGSERQQILDDFLASQREIATLPPMSAKDILPVIRSKDFAAGTPLDNGGLASQAFVGDMVVFYVHDTPRSMSYVSVETRDELGLDQGALHALALANFDARGFEPAFQGEAITMLTLDGNYEASFLLMSELWETLDSQQGTIGAVALARDVVLFGDLELEGLGGALQQIAADNFANMSYAISPELIYWQGGAWHLAPN